MTGSFRILHIVGSLNLGGVETSLRLLTRQTRQSNLTFDFLTLMERGRMATELEAMGSRILTPPSRDIPRGVWGIRRFLPHFKALLRERAYDGVHCHVFYLAGPLLRWAHQAGVPVRVAQAHISAGLYHTTLKSRLTIRISTHLLHRHATAIAGVSRMVLTSYFGERSRRDPRFHILPAACDITHAFACRQERRVSEREVKNVVQVGRLHPAKNHLYTLKVARICHERGLPFRFTFIGDGDERKRVQRAVDRLGLQKSIAMPGFIDDVPGYLAREADIFIFPSLHEGIPIALLEAQAVGLPCLLSDRVDPAAILVPEQVISLPLGNPHRWVEHLTALLQHPDHASGDLAERFRQTLFNPENNLQALTGIYGLV